MNLISTGLLSTALILIVSALILFQSLQIDSVDRNLTTVQASANNTTTLSPFFAEPSALMQIHIAIVSASLLIVVFSYEYSESNVGTFTSYRYLMNFG